MKKWKKSIIISASLLTPIIPTVALLSSCSNTNSSGNLSADWTTSFENIKEFTGISNVNDLIEQLNSSDNTQLLKKICIVLNITVPENNEIKLQSNPVQNNNSLFFTILVGQNLQDNNLLNIKKYSSAITNLNPNMNNGFSNTMLYNDVVNQSDFSNNFYSIYGMNLVSSNQVNVTPVQDAKYPSYSEVVQTYLNNITYTLKSDNSNDSNLKIDLNYFLKNSFLTNFKEWNIQPFELAKYNCFADVKITPIAISDNSASSQTTSTSENFNAELCLQIQNNSSTIKEFKFLNQSFELNRGNILTLKVTINNISRTNLLDVNYIGDVGLSFDNVTLAYQVSGSKKEEIKNLKLTIDKSFSVNTTLSNVTGNNNPYNADTLKQFENIFNSNSAKLSTKGLQDTVLSKITNNFNLRKQEALINSKIIEPFAIPAVYANSNIPSEYDVDKNGIFSVYDLLANIGGPISEWYKLKGFNETADIISNVFSAKPLYLAFHDMFESLTKLLRSMNSEVVLDILDFIEQSLTVNGQVKSPEQFKDFFKNISNLKEVVTPLLVNSGSISAYQLNSILDLIDTLKDGTEQSLWQWLSNNFNSIIDLVNIFISKSTLPQFVKDLITGIGNIQVVYNGKPVKNILTDIPLYNFLSREGLTINNPLSIEIKIAIISIKINGSIKDSDLNGLLNLLIKETDIVSSIGRMMLKQLIRFAVGQPSSMTSLQWANAFKSFWIPKQVNGTANSQSIYDILKNYSNAYTLSNPVWKPLDPSQTTLPDFTLNHQLSFGLNLPNMTFDTFSVSDLSSTPGKVTLTQSSISTSNLVYNHYFPNSSATPIIRTVDNNNFVDFSIPNYVSSSGVSLGMVLSPQNFELNTITEEIVQDNSFSTYSSYIYDDTKKLTLYKGIRPYNPTIKQSDLLDVQGLTGYKVFTKSGYDNFIADLMKYSPDLNLNNMVIKPSVYIKDNTVYMNFPIDVLAKTGIPAASLKNSFNFRFQLSKN